MRQRKTRTKCDTCGKLRLCSQVMLATNSYAKTEKEAKFRPFPLCEECADKCAEWPG